MNPGSPAAVILRPFERRHLAATLEWANDRQLARLLDRPRPIEAAEHEQWFAALPGRNDTLYFAIEAGGRHVGNVWLADIDRRNHKAEVRVVLGADSQGGGHGSQALRLVTDHAFNALNLHRVYAYVLAFNSRAKRSFEKAGFQLEGTLRQDRFDGPDPVDVFVLGRVKGPAPR